MLAIRGSSTTKKLQLNSPILDYTATLRNNVKSFTPWHLTLHYRLIECGFAGRRSCARYFSELLSFLQQLVIHSSRS